MDKMGERIKELRLANKMTQEQLGEKIGVQKSCIAKWENGRVDNMRSRTLAKLADVFNVKPTYILAFDDSTQTAQDELIAYVKGLNEEQQKKALSVLMTMFGD